VYVSRTPHNPSPKERPMQYATTQRGEQTAAEIVAAMIATGQK
jgi:hypothetical protein